jgi:hypothetical protein
LGQETAGPDPWALELLEAQVVILGDEEMTTRR